MFLLWEQDIVRSSDEFENGCIPNFRWTVARRAAGNLTPLLTF